MAQQDIVGSLFGITPELYQQSRAAQDTTTNLTAAQLTPGQLAGFYAMEAGSGLGRATKGLLGIEDPEMKAIGVASQLAKQFDITSPDGLKNYAVALQQAGLPKFASMAVDRYNALNKSALENRKTESEIIKNIQGELPETIRIQNQISRLKTAGDPENMIPALEDRLRVLAKSDIPTSVYTGVIVPQTEKANAAKTSLAQINPVLENIDSGVLKFGLTENFKNKLTTIAGQSDAGSRAASTFNSALEEMRLQAQILQKGSQTDKDAANIMNSFLNSYDKYDTKTVKEQLTRIQKMLQSRQADAESIISQTEKRYEGSYRPSGGIQANKPVTPAAPGAPSIVITPSIKTKVDAIRKQNPGLDNMTDDEIWSLAQKQSRTK